MAENRFKTAICANYFWGGEKEERRGEARDQGPGRVQGAGPEARDRVRGTKGKAWGGMGLAQTAQHRQKHRQHPEHDERGQDAHPERHEHPHPEALSITLEPRERCRACSVSLLK